ncbi:hypothetical protein YPC_3435 [Yersinia pestis biovar Medievalis str. Harbin 35]|nr:hypothetical protein YPC_3435 [Yersinia pestis biovar Medievalis str. Harbin 35]EEO85168.1 hypothetical protein YPH_1010 [Yersinia pestis biovar Orientalis str. PEXU2]
MVNQAARRCWPSVGIGLAAFTNIIISILLG